MSRPALSPANAPMPKRMRPVREYLSIVRYNVCKRSIIDVYPTVL